MLYTGAMFSLPTLIEAWDEAYRELEIAVGGTPDSHLWRRAHPKLLSVGELLGHIGYWQGVWVLCAGNTRPEACEFPFQSPVFDAGFRYYSTTELAPVQLELSASDLWTEVQRVHSAAKQKLENLHYDSEYPGQWGTWGSLVQYQVFHVAYHTGQVYSVRHLLGHETEDN